MTNTGMFFIRMCSRTLDCVLLHQNAFSYFRMRSRTLECVLLHQNAFSYFRMCSLTLECVLLHQNVFSADEEHRHPLASLECVLCVLNVFSTLIRMCSLQMKNTGTLFSNDANEKRLKSLMVCKRTHSTVREHILK